MVNVCSMVLSSRRRKRSTATVSGEDGKRCWVFGLKLRVSTTSVSPSHQPRESPFHWRMSSVRRSRPVDRDDAHVVDVLDADRHGVRRLEDLVGVVVARRDRRHAVVGDAAVPVAPVEMRVGRMLRPIGPLGLGRRRGLRGDGQAPVRRIDDERRPQIGTHPAAVEPEGVVRAHAARRRLAILGHLEVPRRGLLLGVVRAVAETRRPLQRRQRGVRPGALQIRIAPRRQRLAVGLRLGNGRRRQQRDRDRDGDSRREGSIAHPKTSFRPAFQSLR